MVVGLNLLKPIIVVVRLDMHKEMANKSGLIISATILN